MDEAVWLDAFLLPNMVPVFYAETLADLDKEMAEGKSAEDLVGMLAAKTPDNALANVPHRDLLLSELAGGAFKMDGRPVVRAETRQASDGDVGVHVEEAPEQVALHRWQEHEFEAVEREAAKAWRADLDAHDPTAMTGLLTGILPTERKISDLAQLKAFIDEFCAGYDPRLFEFAYRVLDVPNEYKRYARRRWQGSRRPPLEAFFPYMTHLLKVDLLFCLGIARGFISGDRASNKVDMAYLYYLPFCQVFTSGDRLHHRTAPLFVRDDQAYVKAEELKAALGELDAHYEQLPQEIKQRGVMSFTSYPPAGSDNLVARLWDEHMHPEWRQRAEVFESELGEPRDLEADRAMIAELTEKLESAKPLEGPAANVGEDDTAYGLIKRHVSPTKGRWRIVPPEAEDG